MQQEIGVQGRDTQEFIRYLEVHGIEYRVSGDEFGAWVDDTVVIVTIVTSVLTIADILKNWLTEKQQKNEPVNLKMEIGDTEIDFTGNMQDAIALLDNLKLGNTDDEHPHD